MTSADTQGTPPPADAATTPPSPPRWLRQLEAAAMAMRELAHAGGQLMSAEWRLARTAAMTALWTTLLVGVLAVALDLNLLVLAAWLLASWTGSWILALALLGALLTVCLVAAIVLLRRCLYWMSLPETRAQWRQLKHDLTQTRPHPDAGDSKEATHDEAASSID